MIESRLTIISHGNIGNDLLQNCLPFHVLLVFRLSILQLLSKLLRQVEKCKPHG